MGDGQWWCLITPLLTNPTVSSASLPPFFSTFPSSSAVETDFPEGGRGRLRWWICTAEACFSDSSAWKTWRAPGVVQGTVREAHNTELCLRLVLKLCVVSLLSFYSEWCYHMVACLDDLHQQLFTFTNPLCFCSSGGVEPVSKVASSIDTSWKFDTNC